CSTHRGTTIDATLLSGNGRTASVLFLSPWRQITPHDARNLCGKMWGSGLRDPWLGAEPGPPPEVVERIVRKVFERLGVDPPPSTPPSIPPDSGVHPFDPSARKSVDQDEGVPRVSAPPGLTSWLPHVLGPLGGMVVGGLVVGALALSREPDSGRN